MAARLPWLCLASTRRPSRALSRPPVPLSQVASRRSHRPCPLTRPPASALSLCVPTPQCCAHRFRFKPTLSLFLFSLAAACFLPASICNFLQRVFLGLLETLANPESWDCPRVYTSYEQPTLGSGRVGKSSSLASNQEQFTLQRSHKIRLRLGVPCSASPLVLSLLPYYLTRFS